MLCPHCGNETMVTKTLKEEESDRVKRKRKCVSCCHIFPTYECYEPSDPEVAFDASEALQLIEKSRGWLNAPARHIPLVRDSLKLLDRASEILQPKDTSIPA